MTLVEVIKPGRRGRSGTTNTPRHHPHEASDTRRSRPKRSLHAHPNPYGRSNACTPTRQIHRAAARRPRGGLIRSSFRREKPRPERRLLRAVRQTVEPVSQTLTSQLDLEQHGGRTPDGMVVRVLRRIPALTAAIWHNRQTGQPAMRFSPRTTTDSLEQTV
jgi:hypothetical protein